jgi:acetylornithine deacetylase/succinyl-diaminopimelate desuccinylase-like protein
VSRIGGHTWPLEITPTVRRLLTGIEEIIGRPLPADHPDELVRVLGTTARFVGATLRNTSNPTRLDAGYKENVIPGDATAVIDCRYLPGQGEHLLTTIRELAGEGIEIEEIQSAPALEVPFEGDLVNRMTEALLAEDPGAAVLPYSLSGGTDNKAFSLLGITGYGFAPLRLPSGTDFAGMFHGVDERVPLDSLRFGARTLQRFIRTA